MTDYSDISERITKAVIEFTEKLRDSQVQHTSTEAFGAIVEHYAKTIIDAEFANTKFKFVDGVVKLVQEIEVE